MAVIHRLCMHRAYWSQPVSLIGTLASFDTTADTRKTMLFCTGSNSLETIIKLV